MAGFAERVKALPRLGIGVSTEYGARTAPGALDPAALRAAHPRWGAFLEVGVEVAKGLDADALAWAARGWPTTYHFLDVNLDEPEDLDPRWLSEVRAIIDGMTFANRFNNTWEGLLPGAAARRRKLGIAVDG